MKITTRAGTPHHMESKSHTTQAYAKKWLFTRIAKQDEWAGMFNTQMRDELLRIRMEIADMSLVSLPLRDVRRWSVRDEHTGVAICYEVEKEQS